MPTLEKPQVDEPSHDLPGQALPEWQLFNEAQDGRSLTTPEGRRYQLGSSESLVFVSSANGREPYIQMGDDKDNKVPFEHWGPRNVSKNMERLKESGEVGEYLTDLYAVALAQDPRLEAVVINPSDSQEREVLAKTGGFATHLGESGSGRYEVTLNTGDGWEHFEKLLESRRASVEISAKKMGIDPAELDAKFLAGFIFLHEMGHIVDYMDNSPEIASFKERRQKEMKSLPFPGYNPAKLANWFNTQAGQDYWQQHGQAWAAQGFKSPKELVERQEKAYHDIETEDNPDRFAARAFQASGLI